MSDCVLVVGLRSENRMFSKFKHSMRMPDFVRLVVFRDESSDAF